MKKISNKQKILNYAQKKMDEGTFESITIRDICTNANVSIGSFYHYFHSKDDLIIDQYLSNADEFEQFYTAESLAENEWDNLRTYVKFQIEYTLNASLERVKYVYSYNINHNEVSLDRHEQMISIILSRAKEKGQMKEEFSIEEIVDHFFILVTGNIFRYCVKKGEYDIKTQLSCQVEHLISLIEKKN